MVLSTYVCGYVNSGCVNAGFAPPARINADINFSQRVQRRNFQAEQLRLGKSHKDPAPEGFLPSFEGSDNQVKQSWTESSLTYPQTALAATWSFLLQSLRERFTCWEFRPWSWGHLSDLLEKNESLKPDYWVFPCHARQLRGCCALPCIRAGSWGWWGEKWVQSLGHRHRKLQRHPWHQVPPWPGGLFWTLLKTKSHGFAGLLFLNFR